MGSWDSIKQPDIDLFPIDLQFAVFSSDEIKRISVVKIITGLTFDQLGHPLPGGLYDRLMGIYGRIVEPCGTCFKIQSCSGHMGHIELNALVYNPFFVQTIHKILTIFCLNCFEIQMKQHECEILMLQLRLIDAGYIIEAQELEIFKSEIVAHNTNERIKVEDVDEDKHPHIAAMYELLSKGTRNSCNNTKTSCALRTALINEALQRPASVKCISCNNGLRKVRYLHRRLVYYVKATDLKNDLSDNKQTTGQNKFILADECRKYLRNIYKNYANLLELLFPILQYVKRAANENFAPIDIFFMDIIPVVPPKARPSNIMNGQITEHPQTTTYRRIIEDNSALKVIIKRIKDVDQQQITEEAKAVYEGIKGATPYEKLFNSWQSLQTSIDMVLDVNRDELSQGLKQVLEKKDGLIRKHMMGKRVNFAARTVITPDPNINVEEVGIPDIFARKLSYPVPVTSWNVTELRKMVMNGPEIHPGANYIQDEKGYTTYIPAGDAAKRESMAKLLFNYPENGIKIVHRHVLNGDILLLNRQPSLHKPSIMAHKVRILKGEKTFRLHYSNCKAYNADFDGDEMNAHFPQSELARSEAYNLVNVANNYLVPKDGTPLGGLIQDQVISGVKLSIRGRFFNRDDYHQLVFQGLANCRGNIKFLPPSILKPRKLWSGKQVLSTIIINLLPMGSNKINLNSVAKIGENTWITKERCKNLHNMSEHSQKLMSEFSVIIMDGELLTGVLDKQQYGATTFGLIHCLYELYGGEVSTNVLTAFTKVFTNFLQREGFTLGVQDILVMPTADSTRNLIIKECREAGNSAVAAALDLDETPNDDELAKLMEEAYVKDPKFRVLLDRKYKSILDSYTNSINKTCIPQGLISKFPANNLQLMVLSGAKGSLVNTMQISSLLGQIELEGKRPPLMISGKSLPSFTSFETSPKSGGFIDGRFMTGIQPQDFFFHCMAGREGLIDTAVKTSRSGYLQRCLIKHLEGLTVNYDLTVRDSDNSVVQFLYGEDGLDILKSKFFNSNFATQFLMENTKIILKPEELKIIKDEDSIMQMEKHAHKIRSWKKKNKFNNRLYSAFTQFSAEIRNEIDVKNPKKINSKTGRTRLDESIIKLWKTADDESITLYRKKYLKCPDPTISIYKQDCYYGSVSEKLEKLITNLKKNNSIADIMYIKNMRALIAPGEPVGLLAAQSIGEPSTQMTLNTFHFAGRGEMNVTLGIPRLREILMLASATIKTPSMDIPINVEQEKYADKLRIKLNRVTLADILEVVNVKYKLILKPEQAYEYEMFFKFLPREVYESEFCVRPKRVIKYMTDVFFQKLFKILTRPKKKGHNKIIDHSEDKKKKHKNNDADADNNDINPEVDGRKKSKNTQLNNDNNYDDDNNEADESGSDEDDATGIKLKSRKQDETEYDDPDDVEELKDANDDDENDVEILEETVVETATAVDDEVDNKMVNNSMVHHCEYDKKNYLWLKLIFRLPMHYEKEDFSSTLRELANKSVIHQISNIKRAIIYKGQDNVQLLKTDGINIVEMFKYDKILNLNSIYSNDIHAIAGTYGIEAATQVIIKEVSNVFKVYGITVDRRHLSLIADYMTFDGTFRPLSRRGMEHSSSPLQQMSFESCLQFLKTAASSGRTDELNSPSSRLMVALPIKNGTGAFELLTQINY